jgi:xylose isomerase
MDAFGGLYSPKKAGEIKAQSFDRESMGVRGLAYEKLDQLTVELLLGTR